MTSTAIDMLDGLSSSTAIKGPCRAATTANITLSGQQTIDGIAVVTGDRVLVKNQTDGRLNGIWICDTGPWRRARDFDKTNDVAKGTQVLTTDGTANTGSWYVNSSDPIIIGTTSIAFISALDIGAFAPKASPAFTGTPTAPTAAPGTNTTQLATTGFVKAAIDVVLGGVSAAFDTLAEIVASMVRKDADTALTAGYTATAVDDGTKTTGTYTPSPAGGNFRKINSNGAFAIAAPSASGCYNLTVDITNGASAGTVTFSGFATGHPKGASLTTTNANKFKIHISKTDIGVTANIEALQ